MRFDHVYACVTRYQLLCMILHRLRHPNGTSVLFLLDLTFAEEESARVRDVLERSALFDSVRVYEEGGVWNRLAVEVTGTGKRHIARDRFSIDQLPEVSQRILDHFKAQMNAPVHDGTRWYVGGDQYSFGLALVFAGIRYAQFEDHSGSLDHPELFRNTFKRLNPFQHKIYELTAEARRSAVCQLVVDSRGEAEMAHDAQVEQLRVRHALDSLPPEDLSRICATFNYDPGATSSHGGDVSLLITQPFARWKFLDWAAQKELYFTLVDYFAPHSRLIVKPHPQDFQIPYDHWFPGAVVISADVPIEVVLTSVRPSRAITVGSTAMLPLRGTGLETVFLGQGFEQVFRHLPRLFALSTVLKWAGAPSVVCASGFPRDALHSLMGAAADGGDLGNVLVCWAEGPPQDSLDRYDFVASFTPLQDVVPGVFEFIVVARRQQRGRPYLRQSFLYLYSRNANRFDALKGKTLELTLPNLKEDLMVVFPGDGDTVFLQAQVASLEARVQSLTERIRELETEAS